MKRTKKIAICGILTALAFGLSYIEYLIPFDAIGIPGIKLGLPNLVILLALYLLGFPYAAVISAVRLLLNWFLFGNMTSFLYSLAGGVLSLLVMTLLVKRKWMDEIGTSIAGAAMHNSGQILVAMLLMRNVSIASYLPVLLVTAVVTGACIGIAVRLMAPRLRTVLEKTHH